MAQTKTTTSVARSPRTSRGGLLTAKQLSDVSVPLGLVLAKKSIESFSKKAASSAAKKPSATKKGGALTAKQISDISVPLGLVLAKKGAEKLMKKAPAKKGGSSCGSSNDQSGGRPRPRPRPTLAEFQKVRVNCYTREKRKCLNECPLIANTRTCVRNTLGLKKR